MIPDLFNLIKWLLIGNNPNWSYPPSIPPSASHNFITSQHSNLVSRFLSERIQPRALWLRARYDTLKPLHTNIFIKHVTKTCSSDKQNSASNLARKPNISFFCHFFRILGNFVRNELKLTNWVKYSREESKFKFKSTLCNIPVLLRHR